MTYVENLPSIVRCGLVPGGIDGGNRLALHFGAFAPWDEMNVATKTTLRNVRKRDPIAIIYIPSATLARYAANGTFMVFDVIPFYEVKSIWIGKSLNLGKNGYTVNVSAIISAIDPNKCDTPLLDWCLRKGRWLPEDHNKKCVRAQEAQKNLDEEFRRRTHRLSFGDRYAS